MQPDFDKFLKQVIRDVRVELDDEFDRNFERKAFFNVPWVATKLPNNRGSLMMRSGIMRQSLRSIISDRGINYSSSVPYAGIHNEGGKLTVTAKMKRFFWAMYYKASGAIDQRKDGKDRNTKRNRVLSQEAENWKGLALMKLGAELKIPQRQYIGPHPQVDEAVHRVVADNTKELEQQIRIILQNAGNR